MKSTVDRSYKNSKKKLSSKWDPVFELLFIAFLNAESPEFHSGVEVGRKAVDYFKGESFVHWVIENQAQLIKKHPACFSSNKNSLLDADAALEIGNRLIQKLFIHRADNASLSTSPKNKKVEGKTKWPTRLSYSSMQVFDNESFYVIDYERASSWNHFLLAIIILAVIVVCMFPAWPQIFKLVVWYLLVALSTVLIVLIVLRLIFFMILWYSGYTFWFLPNFFNEELGVIDSFKPAYTIHYRNDNWMMVGMRVILALLTACTFYQLSKQHTIGDVSRFAQRQFLDIVDWGHQKLAAAPSNDTVLVSKRGGSIQPDEDVDESQMYDCMNPCGFENFETIKEECMFDCGCMTALVQSHCYKTCSKTAREILLTSQIDICEAAPEDLEHDEGKDGETKMHAIE